MTEGPSEERKSLAYANPREETSRRRRREVIRPRCNAAAQWFVVAGIALPVMIVAVSTWSDGARSPTLRVMAWQERLRDLRAESFFWVMFCLFGYVTSRVAAYRENGTVLWMAPACFATCAAGAVVLVALLISLVR